MEGAVISSAASPPLAKLFAGGTSPEMGEVALGDHLEGYTRAERGGDLKRALDAVEKSDGVTSVDLKNRETSDHLNSGLSRANSSFDKTPNKKNIFVCGVPQSTTDYELRTYFKKFGMVTDVFLMQDHITNHPEEIGFITFDLEESACEVLKNQFHVLNGKTVEVKKAVQDVDTYPRQNGNAHNDNYTFGTPNVNPPEPGNIPSGPYAYSNADGGPHSSGIGWPHSSVIGCPLPYYFTPRFNADNGFHGSMGYGNWYTSPSSVQNHGHNSHNNSNINIISSYVSMNLGGHTDDSGVAGSANEGACQTAATEAAATVARRAD